MENKILEICNNPKSKREIADSLKSKDIRYLTEGYLKPLIEKEKLQMIIPDKPTSKNKKYIRTKI